MTQPLIMKWLLTAYCARHAEPQIRSCFRFTNFSSSVLCTIDRGGNVPCDDAMQWIPGRIHMCLQVKVHVAQDSNNQQSHVHDGQKPTGIWPDHAHNACTQSLPCAMAMPKSMNGQNRSACLSQHYLLTSGTTRLLMVQGVAHKNGIHYALDVCSHYVLAVGPLRTRVLSTNYWLGCAGCIMQPSKCAAARRCDPWCLVQEKKH
jgi:hypothetical protein